MKVLFFSCWLLVTGLLHAQSFTGDSTILLPHWKKNDTRTIVINHTKTSEKDGKAKYPTDFTFIANIRVLDSTAEGYRIEWSFSLTDSFKKANPGIETAMPLYNGFKTIFTTNPDGSFKDLLNWQELVDIYFDMLLLTTRKGAANDSAQLKAKALFNSKERAEAGLIREIQLYYAPYGAVFSTTPQPSAIMLPNPFGGASLPAVSSQQIISRAPSKNQLIVNMKQELDSTGTRLLMNGMIDALNVPNDTLKQYMDNWLGNFQIRDEVTTSFNNVSGWIEEIRHERVANAAIIKQTEVTTIKMEGRKPD